MVVQMLWPWSRAHTIKHRFTSTYTTTNTSPSSGTLFRSSTKPKAQCVNISHLVEWHAIDTASAPAAFRFHASFFCAGHLCIPFLLQGSAPTSVSQVSTQWWLDEFEVHVPFTVSTQRWFDKSGARMPCANQRSKKQTYRRTTLTHQFTQHKTLSLLHVFFL